MSLVHWTPVFRFGSVGCTGLEVRHLDIKPSLLPLLRRGLMTDARSSYAMEHGDRAVSSDPG